MERQGGRFLPAYPYFPSLTTSYSKASVSAPVKTCDNNNNPLSDPDIKSGCDGGTAFTCANNQPWAVDDNTAYGFAAVAISGQTEADWCCQCYELTFTSTSIAGKKLVSSHHSGLGCVVRDGGTDASTQIVQATNTGGDLGSNHFDLLIPGGGLGTFLSSPSTDAVLT